MTATSWKLVKNLRCGKATPQYSVDNPPTISHSLKISHSQIQRDSYDKLLTQEPPPKPSGIFIVALHTAKLSIPEQYKHSRGLPYAIIDFDHSQVRLDARSGTQENAVWTSEARPFPWHLTKFNVSRSADLTVHLYLSADRKNHNLVPLNTYGDQDISLGIARLQPAFFSADDDVEERKLEFQSVDIFPGGSILIGTGFASEPKATLGQREVFLRRPTSPRTDYESAYVRVWTLKERESQQVYAVRSRQKEKSIGGKADLPGNAPGGTYLPQASYVAINHPFIVTIAFVVEDEEKLCLLSPLMYGGHLFYYLQMEGRFGLGRAMIYTGEVVSALEYLHAQGITFCGKLKAGSLRLDSVGHIVICDFDLWRRDEGRGECSAGQGADFPAPEAILGEKGTMGSGTTHVFNAASIMLTFEPDWWTLGCLLFEMLLGFPPFVTKTEGETRSRILSNTPLLFPGPTTIPETVKDLLRRLLCKQEHRLGVEEIKRHPFFADIDWNKLIRREYVPIFKPSEEGPTLPRRQRRRIHEQLAFFGSAFDPKERLPNHFDAETTFEQKNDILMEEIKRIMNHDPLPNDRILQTQILGGTVDRHDILLMTQLLSSGVSVDFQDSDCPPDISVTPGCYGEHPEAKRALYVPPLVRAVGWSNLKLVKILLEAGADANVGYHGYSDPKVMLYGKAFSNSCGRVIQLAMLLQQEDIVELLLDFGADIHLAQPKRRGHQCQGFGRRSWIRITAALRERREGRERSMPSYASAMIL